MIDSANQTAPTNQTISATSTHVSGGAIAGIVVGAIFLVILVLVIGFYIRRKRRRTASVRSGQEYDMLNQNPIIAQKDDSQFTEARMSELETSDRDPYIELENSQRAELGGSWAGELESAPARVELEETKSRRPTLL